MRRTMTAGLLVWLFPWFASVSLSCTFLPDHTVRQLSQSQSVTVLDRRENALTHISYQ